MLGLAATRNLPGHELFYLIQTIPMLLKHANHMRNVMPAVTVGYLSIKTRTSLLHAIPGVAQLAQILYQASIPSKDG